MDIKFAAFLVFSTGLVFILLGLTVFATKSASLTNGDGKPAYIPLLVIFSYIFLSTLVAGSVLW